MRCHSNTAPRYESWYFQLVYSNEGTLQKKKTGGLEKGVVWAADTLRGAGTRPIPPCYVATGKEGAQLGDACEVFALIHGRRDEASACGRRAFCIPYFTGKKKKATRITD